MYKMTETVNLAEARKNLPQLADGANAGQVYIVSRRGREIAALIGIEEYKRLKTLEMQQSQQDFNILLAPPTEDMLTEDEARELAVRVVREVRQERYKTNKTPGQR
jgi:prevent-host-death family protein